MCTKKHFLKLRYLLGVCLIISQFGISSAQAVTAEEEAANDYYASQAILFYSKYATSCSPTATTEGSVAVTVNGSENAEKIFNFFTSTSFKTNGGKPMNAVQAAAFVGNFMQESGEALDPTVVNSIGATGIAQWLGVRLSALQALAGKLNKPATNLEVQLAFVKQELENDEVAIMLNSDFKSGTNIEAITVAIRKVYERPGEAEAADSKRIAYAKGIHEKYKGNAPSTPTTGDSTSSSPDACAAGSTTAGSNATQGDLVKTALGFAWDKPVETGVKLKKDARPEYVAAMAEFSKINNDSDATAPFSDCGRFVSNVMRASGLDKNYPLVGTSTQIAYAQQHSDLYEVISNPKMSDFKTGDIFASPMHTAIYTGSGEYDTVDASLDMRVPAVSDFMSYYIGQSGSVLIRYIGNGAS